MQKKNLIYIVGGAAILGYFIYMKKKKSSELPSATETPDQALAPAFVNETTDVIKKVANTAKAIKSRLKRRGSKNVDESAMMTTSEQIISPSSPLSEIMFDMSPVKKSILSAKQAKQNVRASGGTAKQARQAARSVRKEARAARKMGELSVTF